MADNSFISQWRFGNPSFRGGLSELDFGVIPPSRGLLTCEAFWAPNYKGSPGIDRSRRAFLFCDKETDSILFASPGRVILQVVQQHLETWGLPQVRVAELDSDPVPPFVERDLRKYLECGILAQGFARARCAGCGHNFLIS
jgi:hypothetical protein